jgi:hypothetical protein
MYSLRSKRSIVHKGSLDPNRYDLRLLFAGAQWVMAELISSVNGVSMDEAGRLVEQVQVPVDGMVEVLHGKRVVHGVMTMREEILALLLSYYPDPAQPKEIAECLERRSAGSVRNALAQLWKEQALQRVEGAGYVLTNAGLREAREIAFTPVERGAADRPVSPGNTRVTSRSLRASIPASPAASAQILVRLHVEPHREQHELRA